MSARRVDDIVKWVKGPSILDIGCTGHTVRLDYPGWLHGRLRKQFPRVSGIDINEENIRQLEAAGFDNLYVQNAENMDLPETYDTIVAGEVIEHLANPGLFLEGAKKHIKKDGIIVITTPYPFSITYGAYAVFKYPKTCENSQHTMWFCVQTMRTLAERVGLYINHWELLDDVMPTGDSKLYNTFTRVLRFLQPIIPKRLMNQTMLFVLSNHQG